MDKSMPVFRGYVTHEKS